MTFTNKRYREYRQSAKGKATIRRYEQSAKAKTRRRNYRSSAKGRAGQAAIRLSRRRAVREIIAAAKAVPCCDCAGLFPICCMDFHHLRDKRFAIGGGKRTPKSVRAEIAKCVVICSNCHRIRHAKGPVRNLANV